MKYMSFWGAYQCLQRIPMLDKYQYFDLVNFMQGRALTLSAENQLLRD